MRRSSTMENTNLGSRDARPRSSTAAAVAGVLAWWLSAPPVGAADSAMSKEYSACMDKAGGVTAEMIDCINAETKRHDARLNENYKKLTAKLSADRKKALLEAQRAWMKFRDANCSFYADPQGGSIARVTANECYLNATADRAKELGSLLDAQ